ncbi:MAG: flagellar biosynthetic protein FliO [Lachnospiraceae bacterium]|nr:flagellar biosynthetic protein FliO [Lachnospiraceae bacterium]
MMKSKVLLAAMGGDLLSLVSALLMFVCVLALAYWFSRFLGKRLKYANTSSDRNMKVIEQISFRSGPLGRGTGEQLILLKIKEKTYLIGVSSAGFQLLDHLEGEFAEESASDKPAVPMAFGEVFKKYAGMRRKEKEKKDE